MRSIVTGAEGQLGRDICRLLPEARAMGRKELSIDDQDMVWKVCRELRPEIIFNCAAYNGVDRAEQEVESARAVNERGPGYLAQAAAELGAHLVHFSTNYVFDGSAETAYSEEDPPSPTSAYARSKRAGEEAVLAALPSALVIRSSGLFGRQGSAIKGGSFPERILAKARTGEPLRIVSDQRLNPTATSDLAAGTLHLVDSGMSGIIHLVAAGCCSWWEFTCEILRLAGIQAEVAKVTTAELNLPAARPLNGCLRSVRVEPLRPWQEGLADLLKDLPSPLRGGTGACTSTESRDQAFRPLGRGSRSESQPSPLRG